MKNIKNQLIILVFLLAACKQEANKDVKSTEVASTLSVTLTEGQLKNTELQLITLQKKLISTELKVNGVLDVPPQNLVSVSVAMNGNVAETHVIQGTHVHKGQVLATIHSQDFINLQQEYLQNWNKLTLVEEEFKRQETLNKENVSSGKVFQQANTEFLNVKNQTVALEQKLKILGVNVTKLKKSGIQSSLLITSPLNGYVTTVNVNLGSNITPSDVLFEIVNLDHIHAELSVFEKDILNIKEGQKVVFSPINQPSEKFNAKIYLINHKINTDRTIQVHAHLSSNFEKLLPGMFISASIFSDAQNKFVIPDEAIFRIENQFYVFVKGNTKNNFQCLLVKKGVSENGFTEVLNYQQFENKQIVTKGAYELQGVLLNTEEE